ncbi:MAG: anti-sigma-D factor RsdA [Sciscionella sp.]
MNSGNDAGDEDVLRVPEAVDGGQPERSSTHATPRVRWLRGPLARIVPGTTGEDTSATPVAPEDPVDLSKVAEDDTLISALAAGTTEEFVPGEHRELAALLLSWRREVDSEPVPQLLDTETAMALLQDAKHSSSRRRLLVPFATAAAVLAIVFGGVSLAARNAHPGDTLWTVSQVLYTDHARSVEASYSVRSDLNQARMALHLGKFGDARKALSNAAAQLPVVSQADGKVVLYHQHQILLDQLGGTAPPVTFPVLPDPSSANKSTPAVDTTPSAPPLTSTNPPPAKPTSPPPSSPPPKSSTPPPSTGNSSGGSKPPTDGNGPGGGAPPGNNGGGGNAVVGSSTVPGSNDTNSPAG